MGQQSRFRDFTTQGSWRQLSLVQLDSTQAKGMLLSRVLVGSRKGLLLGSFVSSPNSHYVTVNCAYSLRHVGLGTRQPSCDHRVLGVCLPAGIIVTYITLSELNL